MTKNDDLMMTDSLTSNTSQNLPKTPLPSLDIVVPCYQSSQTLQRTVDSCLRQKACQKIWLVDDGSNTHKPTDNTWQLIQQLQRQHPDKIYPLQLPHNCGVATARNWGAICSQADLIAFIDSDDAYEDHALDSVAEIFWYLPQLSLLRLRLQPINLDKKYSKHPQFEEAWKTLQMTVGGNTIFRRGVFLACGGFPQDKIFKKFGGEDGALGIALTKTTMVGTLFEPEHAGVKHYCRANMHATRLLNAKLFNQYDKNITAKHLQYAEQTTQRIITQVSNTAVALSAQPVGVRPIHIEYEKKP